jgi:nitrite reductase/ring-hydroxylating ferredoxin subunit/uncharacterized membrane protein
MRSTASVRGHPIHPMLIPFPIAFLTGGFLADVVGVLSLRPTLYFLGYYLVIAGVGMALIAAIPGFIDYFFTVPPRSSAKKRATLHMITNLSLVLVFAVAWFSRNGAGAAPSTAVLMLETLGTVLLGVAGWMGGNLVSQNLISVDNMYANAGGWSEERFHQAAGPIAVAKADELKVNQMKLLHIDGQRIVLGRTEDGYVAFDDSCTHKGGSLAGGAMICGTVQCLWHGSQFDVATGEVKSGPARKRIGTYDVTEKDGKVMLTLRAAPSRERARSHQET